MFGSNIHTLSVSTNEGSNKHTFETRTDQQYQWGDVKITIIQ